jgi:hypothetical protein
MSNKKISCITDVRNITLKDYSLAKDIFMKEKIDKLKLNRLNSKDKSMKANI